MKRAFCTAAGALALVMLVAPADAKRKPPPPKPTLGPVGPDVLIGGKPGNRVLKQPPRVNNLLVAIDTPYQIFENQGSYVHVAAWYPGGNPAVNASVFVGGHEVGKTDGHGSLVFLYPPKGSGRDSAIGADSVTVRAGSRYGSVPFNPYLRTASFAADKLFVYTDRGVYRPGETIHVRNIAWHLEQDYQPAAAAAVEIRLEDHRGRTVSGGTVRTDDFGIGAMNIPLPGTATEGLYTLHVSYKQARESTRLQVREFKPPQIRIEHDLGRFITADQKQLGFAVTLRAATGKPIESARLRLSARAGGTEVVQLQRQVTGPGPHRFALTADQLAALKKSLKEGQFASFQLDVRDRRGRTAELRRELRYTANPYVAVLETDKDQYTTGDPVEIVAKISDLDGVPLRGKNVTLRVDGTVLTATTSDKGMALFSTTMPKKGAKAELHIAGVSRPVASTYLRWIQLRPMNPHIAAPIIKEGGSARVTVKFPAHVVPAEKVVHMDVTDTSGAIVNAVLLPVSKVKGKWIASGSFKAPTWGSMLLTFFALGRDTKEKRAGYRLGLLTEGQNLVVHPDRELTITLDGLPDEAPPGQAVNLGIKVTDPAGNPVRASVGVMGVDRRVLSLKDPLEITPMDQLYDPKMRTMSTAGSKILSWPVVSRNWGARRHDVALPPFPFLPGGPAATMRRRSSKAKPSKKSPKIKSAKIKINKNVDLPMADDDDDFDADGIPDELDAKEESVGVGGYGTIGHGSGTGSGYGMGGGKSAGRGRGRPAQVKKPTVITIRTKFPETFLWQPSLVAEAGRATLRAELPHALGDQELVLVASDMNGGVGVARARIAVDQKIFVQADFPESLRAGESVAVPVVVHNKSNAALRFVLAMNSDAGTSSQQVEVPAGDIGGALFTVRGDRAGTTRFELKASAPGFTDIVRGSARVAPGGAAHAVVTTGVAGANAPFLADLAIPATGSAQASLSVAFPAVTSAFLGVDALSRLVSSDPLALASDLLSAAMVLEYARKHKLQSRALDRLDSMVRRALLELEAAQSEAGGFSFWRNRKPSPYVTAWVLEGMLAARRIGVRVKDDSIRRAAAWLANEFDGNRVRIAEIAWWEGDSDRVKLGLTAEVFDVLSQLPSHLTPPGARKLLDALSTELSAELDKSDVDPLTAGRTIQGLARRGELDRDRARALVKRLAERRDKGHWEPSWFHAYGGNVEATVAMVAAMQQVDPTGFQAEKRDALAWILSTRDAWGQWHNERGTAQAIRALLLVGAPPEEVPGTVTVEIDGRVVESVQIDPADPFLSAMRLGQVEIGRRLKPGVHKVAVRYDGKLMPTASLAVRTWQRADSARAIAGKVVAWSTAPAHLTVDRPVDVRVDIARPADAATRLVVSPSNLVEVDLQRLARHIAGNPGIDRYKIVPEGIRIDLAPGTGRASVAIPFVGSRAGSGDWPSIAVVAGSATLRTSPGELHVQ